MCPIKCLKSLNVECLKSLLENKRRVNLV
jgi:hypothetical protein